MIVVLRLGHRPDRDKRVTTHVALTARAFGADRVLVDRRDPKLEATIRDVVRRFGGSFEIETGVRARAAIRDFPGTTVQLTMYGERMDAALTRIPKDELMVVVGGEKVPGYVFHEVDRNVAVGDQPHSEVAALAVFLDRLLEGRPLRRRLRGRLTVVPSERGKIVRERTP